VNAFSEYARAPAMQLADFDLNALVREVAELYRAHEARVGFRLELAPGETRVHADRGRIRQVLNNLLTNSIEALESEAEPAITVGTRRATGGLVELEVRDNGPGFQRELIGQVFDPYVTSKPKGTGLGLAIVRKIVDEHGGRIEAENGPQGGARVRLWLPTDDAARAASAPREPRRTEPRREHA
jgi:nitrogen fixation/metabolism regulation signal transduction histidine kinase